MDGRIIYFYLFRSIRLLRIFHVLVTALHSGRARPFVLTTRINLGVGIQSKLGRRLRSITTCFGHVLVLASQEGLLIVTWGSRTVIISSMLRRYFRRILHGR